MTLNIKSGFIALLVPAIFMVLLLCMAAFPMGLSVQHGRIVSCILGAAIAIGIVHLVTKVERSTLRDYQVFIDSKTPTNLAIGFALSLLLGGSMIFSHISYSHLQISPNYAHLQSFIWMSLTLIPFAFMEEVIFRSYVLIKLKDTYNIWVAQIVVAILFALYHVIGMQGQSLISAFIGPGIWSLIFGALAIKSKGIAMPTAFHFGLNLLLAVIGDKSWVPGLWTLEFQETPSEATLQSHENFGLVLHLLLLVIGIVATYYLNKHMSKPKNQTS